MPEATEQVKRYQVIKEDLYRFNGGIAVIYHCKAGGEVVYVTSVHTLMDECVEYPNYSDAHASLGAKFFNPPVPVETPPV
jgi:hypothetical protein